MHRTTTLGSSPLEKQVFTNQLTQKWLNIFLSPTYPCFTFPGIYSRSFFPNFPRRNARSVSIVLHCIHYIFYCFHLYIWLTFYADATDFEYAGERLIPEVFTYSLLINHVVISISGNTCPSFLTPFKNYSAVIVNNGATYVYFSATLVLATSYLPRYSSLCVYTILLLVHAYKNKIVFHRSFLINHIVSWRYRLV